MSAYGWSDALPSTRAQAKTLVSSLRQNLGEDLIGVYLHGSLAMNCFNPTHSDLDLLVVLEHEMDMATKRQVAETLLGLSLQPHPIEISFLTVDDLDPWQFPTPYDFHYSENWREVVQEHLGSGEWQHWHHQDRGDADLAAHITVLNHRGVVLWGAPIEDVFPVVPARDYLTAIWDYDTRGSVDWIAERPVYGILNLCRVLLYVTDGTIASKSEGGIRASGVVPCEYRPLIERSLSLYHGDADASPFDPVTLDAFVNYMTERIEGAIDRLGLKTNHG